MINENTMEKTHVNDVAALAIKGGVENQIRENVKFLRKKFGESQQKLAESIGEKPDIIAKLEQGATKPQATVLFKIAANYKVSMDFIFGLTDYESGADVRADSLPESLDFLLEHISYGKNAVKWDGRIAPNFKVLYINKKLSALLDALYEADVLRAKEIGDHVLSPWIDKEKQKFLDSVISQDKPRELAQYALLPYVYLTEEVMRFLESEREKITDCGDNSD